MTVTEEKAPPLPGWVSPALVPAYAPSRLPFPAWGAPLQPAIETLWRPGWLNAVSKVGSTTEGTTATTSFTVSAGSNSLILVRVAYFQSPSVSITGITYNGVALSQGAVKGFGGTEDFVEIWGLVAPATGAHNVVVSFSAAVAFLHVYIDQWDGVDQTTPFGTQATAQGTSTAPSVAVSGAANDMMVDCMGFYNGGSVSITSGQTLDEKDEENGAEDSSAGSHAAGGASVTMSYTLSSSSNWWICGVALKAVSGGGGAVLNDANFMATYRGMGVGMNRGMR